MIPVYKPHITKLMQDYVNDCMQTGWISWQGKYVEEAESMLSELTGAKHCILTSNGTTATHLLARSLKKFHPEVSNIVVPSACYVAAWNAFLFDGFPWNFTLDDLDIDTWNSTYANVHDSPKTALLVVSNLGNIVNVPALKRRFPSCIIVEDNCEGLFGYHEGVHSGTESLCSSLSFFANKNITTGEGGAFLTNDAAIYEYTNKLKGQGQTAERYVHDELGYNYRMTNIQAAMLVGQLKEVDEIIENKRRVFSTYKDALSDTHAIRFQVEEKHTLHSSWMFGIRLPGLSSFEIAHRFYSMHGIEIRPMFYPYSAHPHLPLASGDMKNATLLNRECIILPSFPGLSKDDIHVICNVTKEFIRGGMRG